MIWAEIEPQRRLWTLSGSRTKNGRAHPVHLSEQAWAVLERMPRSTADVFVRGRKPFTDFAKAKLELDRLSGVTGWRLHDLRRTAVSGMARLGVAPHVADKILNHQSGTISGVAAIYQRHEFMAERKVAIERWGDHLSGISRTPDLSL